MTQAPWEEVNSAIDDIVAAEKEDRKDNRVDKQSSNTSTLIKQRQDGTPPTNFESSEDTLDGLGFDGFG